jgi:hypothetical protein
MGAMSINAANLPKEVLGYVFSYLDLQSLGRAAQVCQGWNVAQKTDWLWHNLCRSILDLPTTSQSSWKEQYQILLRWRNWEAEEEPLSTPSKAGSRFEFFTFLKDDTVLEVVRPDPSKPSLYSVRNLRNHEEVRQIDLESHGCGQILDAAVCESTWTILDANGKIFQFNVGTGMCINQFSGDPIQDGRSCNIYCNDHEIVSNVGNRVQIWDLQQRRLRQTFEIAEDQEIWRLCSTTHFALCFCAIQETGSTFVLAVNKYDPSLQTRTEERVEPCSFQSYGAYCSFLTEEGQLHVYEDTPDAQFRLVRAHAIQMAPSQQQGVVQMYRNWVCVSKDDVVEIFDVRTGATIASRNPNWGTIARVQINAQAVLFYHFPRGTHSVESSGCSLYDFRRRIQQ